MTTIFYGEVGWTRLPYGNYFKLKLPRIVTPKEYRKIRRFKRRGIYFVIAYQHEGIFNGK